MSCFLRLAHYIDKSELFLKHLLVLVQLIYFRLYLTHLAPHISNLIFFVCFRALDLLALVLIVLIGDHRLIQKFVFVLQVLQHLYYGIHKMIIGPL